MNVRTFAVEQFGAALQRLLKNPDIDFVQMDASTHFPHFEVSVDPVAPQLMRVQLGIVISGVLVVGTCVVNITDAAHRLQKVTVLFPEAARVAEHPFRDDAVPGAHTFVAKPASAAGDEFVLVPLVETRTTPEP